jgi:hypothetical protein
MYSLRISVQDVPSGVERHASSTRTIAVFGSTRRTKRGKSRGQVVELLRDAQAFGRERVGDEFDAFAIRRLAFGKRAHGVHFATFVL